MPVVWQTTAFSFIANFVYSIMNEKNLCVSCFEPITNPICEWCYMKQISRWLDHKGLKEKEKEKEFPFWKKPYHLKRRLKTNVFCATTKMSKFVRTVFLWKSEKLWKKLNCRRNWFNLFLQILTIRSEKKRNLWL